MQLGVVKSRRHATQDTEVGGILGGGMGGEVSRGTWCHRVSFYVAGNQCSVRQTHTDLDIIIIIITFIQHHMQ